MVKFIFIFLAFIISGNFANSEIRMDGKIFKDCGEVDSYCNAPENEGYVCCGFGTGCSSDQGGSVVSFCQQVTYDNCGAFNGWKKYKKNFKQNKKNISCYIDTPNLFLYQKSLVKPTIMVRKCKVENKDVNCCFVNSGKWEVITGEAYYGYVENYKYKIVQDINSIVVKHIIHPTYLSYTMEHCDKKDDYYNFMDNLAIFDKEFYKNRTSEGIHYFFCNGSNEYCNFEQEACNKISNYFKDNKVCKNEGRQITDIIYE